MERIQLPFFYLSEVHYIQVLMSNSDIPEVPADNKAAPFEITAHTYKIVDGYSILLDIHVPKKLLEKGPSSAEWKKKHPVVVAVHGGWLVSVSSYLNSFTDC